MDEWKPMNGVIVLFAAAPGSDPPLSALDLYKRVWGADPDRFQRQSNPLMPTIAQGKRGGLTANCAIQPQRIDLSLTPPQQGHGPGTTLPLIEDTLQFQSELMRLTEIVGKDLISYPVVRLAMNLHFLTLKPNFEAANAALTAIMPAEYRVKLSDEEDFVFQINHPYTSREPGNFKMNFVTKWSVDRFQILSIPIVTGGAPVSTSQIAATVKLDINSVPQGAPLSGSQQSSLLREALTSAVRQQKDIGLNAD